MSFPAVLVSALIVYNLLKFHALIVLRKMRDHERSQLCCAMELRKLGTAWFISSKQTLIILEDLYFRAATI